MTAIRHHIDKIKVQESKRGLEHWRQTLATGVGAAEALLWFQEYASGDRVDNVLTVGALLVASSTPGASLAQTYITHAARKYDQMILDDAVQQARADHVRAESAREKMAK